MKSLLEQSEERTFQHYCEREGLDPAMVREFKLPLHEVRNQAGYWLAHLVTNEEGWPCYCDNGSTQPQQTVNRNGLPSVSWGRTGENLLLAAACDVATRNIVGGHVIGRR